MKNLNESISGGREYSASSLPSHIIYETSNGVQTLPLETFAFEHGNIYLTGEIDDELSWKFTALLQIAASRDMDLKVFVNSPGGKVSAGLVMLVAMMYYPGNIDIYVSGLAASMAAVLVAGGRPGHRFVMPYSKLMIHEPLISGGMGGSATSIQRTAESIMETKKTINGLLSKFTGRTVEEIDKSTAFDNFLSAEEAVEFGLCDAIATGYERFDNDDEDMYYSVY